MCHSTAPIYTFRLKFQPSSHPRPFPQGTYTFLSLCPHYRHNLHAGNSIYVAGLASSKAQFKWHFLQDLLIFQSDELFLFMFLLRFICSSTRNSLHLSLVLLVYQVLCMCPASLLHYQLLWDRLYYLSTFEPMPDPFPQHVTEYSVQSKCS